MLATIGTNTLQEKIDLGARGLFYQCLMSTLSFGFESSELGQSGSCKAQQWATRLSIFNLMVNVKYYRGLTSFLFVFQHNPTAQSQKMLPVSSFHQSAPEKSGTMLRRGVFSGGLDCYQG